MKKSVYLIFILLFLFNACNNSNENSQQNAVNQQQEAIQTPIEIELKPAKSEYRISDKLELTVWLTDTLKFDSLEIILDQNKVASSIKQPFVYQWDTKSERVGIRSVNAVLHRNKSSVQKQISITLLSDIDPHTYSYKIVKTYKHDVGAYTQGLFFDKGFLYEGTGMLGESSLRKVKLETGEVLKSYSLPENIFGEGIVLFNNKIIQISWQNYVGFVYNKDNFELLQKFNYSTEGWGIATDGKELIMSDGTSTLYFLDPESFSEIKRISVFDNNGAVMRLNELEYIENEIYANIYMTDKIARIDPKSGKVLSYINLDGLLPEADQSQETDVLNGIAYDSATKRLFVTGKRWDKLFEIKLN